MDWWNFRKKRWVLAISGFFFFFLFFLPPSTSLGKDRKVPRFLLNNWVEWQRFWSVLTNTEPHKALCTVISESKNQLRIGSQVAEQLLKSREWNWRGSRCMCNTLLLSPDSPWQVSDSSREEKGDDRGRWYRRWWPGRRMGYGNRSADVLNVS